MRGIETAGREPARSLLLTSLTEVGGRRGVGEEVVGRGKDGRGRDRKRVREGESLGMRGKILGKRGERATEWRKEKGMMAILEGW